MTDQQKAAIAEALKNGSTAILKFGGVVVTVRRTADGVEITKTVPVNSVFDEVEKIARQASL